MTWKTVLLLAVLNFAGWIGTLVWLFIVVIWLIASAVGAASKVAAEKMEEQDRRRGR